MFATFEHYPIILPSNRAAGQTQHGDRVDLYGAVAIGQDRREYQGEWEEVRLIRADGAIIDPCYIPAAAVDIR